MKFYKIATCVVLSFFICVVGLTRSYSQENDQELFQVAQKAFEDGFYDVAMRYIDQLLKNFPQTDKRVEANLLLGQCYFFQSQYLKAYETFQNLLQYNEYKDITLFWLGETNLKGADYKKAEQYYKELIASFPNSTYVPQAYYSLGWVYTEQNKLKEAKDVFMELIKRFPTHQLAEEAGFKVGENEYSQQNYDQAISFFKNFVIKYPNSNKHAESYFYIAEGYYYLNNYLDSVAYYAKAADIAHDNKLTLMAQIGMGWCYLKLGKFDLSEQRFSEAEKLATEKKIFVDDVYLGQANLYSETKDYDKALTAYNNLIAQFPNSTRMAEALLGKANAHFVLKDYDNSVRAYRIVIDKYEGEAQQKDVVEKAYFGLAWSYLKAGSVDLALETFKTVKNHSENKTVKQSALTQIGDAYQDLNEFDQAIEIYDQILKDYPDSAYTDYVQYRQGVALLRMDKLDQALGAFQAVMTNFPNSTYISDIKYYLAVTYFKKEDWLSAQNYSNNFIQSAADSQEFLAEANYILALCYYHLGQMDKALPAFESLIKNFPEQSNIIKNAQVDIAKTYFKKGDVSEAIKRFKLLLDQYPNSEVAEEALIWLGDYYLEKSEFETSISYYQNYIQQFPKGDKISLVYYELGQAYVAKGQYTEAVSSFKKINNPKDAEINTKAKMAIAEIFSKELKPEETISTYMNIVTTAPEFKRDAYNKIAEVYKQSKDYDKAVDAYREALKSDLGSSQIKGVELQFNLADTLEVMDQSKDATDEYLKIPYLYPKETFWIIKAYLRIGRIFEDQEKWEEAKTIYKKILEYKTEEGKFAQERLEWIDKNARL
jgi:TolA-binding protein